MFGCLKDGCLKEPGIGVGDSGEIAAKGDARWAGFDWMLL
jgi:hypothetical protein